MKQTRLSSSKRSKLLRPKGEGPTTAFALSSGGQTLRCDSSLCLCCTSRQRTTFLDQHGVMGFWMPTAGCKTLVPCDDIPAQERPMLNLRKRMGPQTKERSPRVGTLRLSNTYSRAVYLRIPRRMKPASPTSPVPNSDRVPGSGTAAGGPFEANPVFGPQFAPDAVQK